MLKSLTQLVHNLFFNVIQLLILRISDIEHCFLQSPILFHPYQLFAFPSLLIFILCLFSFLLKFILPLFLLHPHRYIPLAQVSPGA